jgi:hypothetical protein
MILLSTSSALLQLVTGGAQTLAVHVAWADYTPPSTVAPSSQDLLVSTSGTTTIAPSPSGSAQRNVKHISVHNNDPSATNQIAVQHYDGTNTINLAVCPLQPGYTLHYEDGWGWYVTDASGGRQGVQGLPGTSGANGTNGTNAGNIGTAILNFGAAPGSNQASVAVTGQTSILSTSAVQPFFMQDTTSDHGPQDHQFADLVISLTASVPTPGVGFTISGLAADNIVGTFQVRFVWN